MSYFKKLFPWNHIFWSYHWFLIKYFSFEFFPGFFMRKKLTSKKSQFWIGLGPIALDFPYISEELTDKSNSKLWLLLVIDSQSQILELKYLIKNQRLLKKIWFLRQSFLEYDKDLEKNIKTLVQKNFSPLFTKFWNSPLFNLFNKFTTFYEFYNISKFHHFFAKFIILHKKFRFLKKA